MLGARRPIRVGDHRVGARQTGPVGHIHPRFQRSKRTAMTTYSAAVREWRRKQPDLRRAQALFQRASRNGDPRASYALATWHALGLHAPKNPRRAVAFLRKAAKVGFPEALFGLGVCYEKGAGVDKNVRRAFELYVAAALRGNEPSFMEVGRCYYYGIGVAKDRGLADLWLERAGVQPAVSRQRQARQKGVGLNSLESDVEVMRAPRRSRAARRQGTGA